MNGTRPRTQRWQELIWLGAGAGLLLTIGALLAFAGISIWRATTLIEERKTADLAFTFSSIGLINLTLLRLLAILIGAAISFAGLAVSFFAHEKATSFEGELGTSAAGSAKATLAAYSPGIVGVFVGAAVIVFALFSKSEHKYEGPRTVTLEIPSAITPSGAASATFESDRLPDLKELLGKPASAPK